MLSRNTMNMIVLDIKIFVIIFFNLRKLSIYKNKSDYFSDLFNGIRQHMLKCWISSKKYFEGLSRTCHRDKKKE